MLNIFDVDYTLIKKTSAWYFIREALAQKVIGISRIRKLPFEWLRYKLGFPNTDFIEQAVRHLAGLDKKTVDDLAADSFNRRMKTGIYAQAARLIAEMRQRGEQVVFATSSFHSIIQPLERFLGVSESIASSLEFSQGKTTGHVAGVSLFGGKKKAAVENWLAERGINPADVCFYSDSYTDIPLMEYCGSAVAVNPDRFLKREAKKRGWQILRFRETLGKG